MPKTDQRCLIDFRNSARESIIATFTALWLHWSDHMLGPPTIDKRAGARFLLTNHVLVSAPNIMMLDRLASVCLLTKHVTVVGFWSFTALNKLTIVLTWFEFLVVSNYLVNVRYSYQSFSKHCWSLLALNTVIQGSVIGCPLYALFALKSLPGGKCHCVWPKLMA